MIGGNELKGHDHASKDLEPIVASIVRYSKPSRILLFGSRARRESRSDSDIDICVLFDRLPKRKLEVLQDLYREFFDLDVGAIDLVVYEEETFKERSRSRHSFEAHILGEGVPLYGQA